MHFFKKCALLTLTVLLTASVLCRLASAADTADCVRFDFGEWIYLDHVSGSPTVEVSDDFLSASAGTLLCPGANGVLCIAVVNDGRDAAKLSLTDSVLKEEAPLQIEVSGALTADSTTVLAPGEECFLHITVRWDPESTDTDVDTDGSFAISLSCDGEIATIEEVPNSIPQTGDTAFTAYSVLAAVSLAALLMLKYFRKRDY